MRDELKISNKRFIQFIDNSLDISHDCVNLDTVLQKILHAIGLMLDCESTSYLEYDTSTKNLIFKHAIGKDSHLVSGLSIPLGKSIAHKVLRDRKGLIINDAHLEKEHYSNIDGFLGQQTKNMLVMPILGKKDAVFGVIEACNKQNGSSFTDEDFKIFSYFCTRLEQCIQHIHTMNHLKENIQQTYTSFEKIAYPAFLYESKEMKQKVELAKKISHSQSPILITGEKGSGKKLLAYHIHAWSMEKNKDYKLPLIINCSHLVRKYKSDISKLEKIFFGEKIEKTIIPGIFLQTKNITIILSEITELPMLIQKQIYNCLQHKKIILQGSPIEYQQQPRIICTSSDDIEDCISNGSFLENLYLHINTLNIYISPLANRPDDIVTITKHYIPYYIKKYQKNIISINSNIYSMLKKYSWPHSVNELIVVLSQSILLAKKTHLDTSDILINPSNSIHAFISNNTNGMTTLKEVINTFKKDYIYYKLIHNGWNCTKTAKILNIQRSYLSRLVKEFKLKDKKTNKTENN